MTKKIKEYKKFVLPCMLCSPTQEYKKKYEDMNYKVYVIMVLKKIMMF
jgi:hypothetical protein